jgi:hypothetical protein
VAGFLVRMRPRTHDAGFGRTMPTQLIVSLAEVVRSSVGQLLVDPVWSVMRFALQMVLLGRQQVEWLFRLESARPRPETTAFGVRLSRRIVSAYAESIVSKAC